MERLTNKELVAYWMDQRKVNDIIIRPTKIVIQVRKSMTPAEADKLVEQCGHSKDAQAGVSNGQHYIIISRY